MAYSDYSVDLLQPNPDKAARKKLVAIAVFFALFVGLFATIGAASSYRAVQHGTSVFTEASQLPGIAEIRRFAWGPDEVASETNDNMGRINILLLGVGGEGHDGAQLTDTIILASLDTKNNKLALFSIPRDLAFPIGNNQFRKINSLNALQESAHPGEGARRSADLIGDLLNIRVDYVMRVDFKGFEKFIDTLGGVDITVEKSFTDNSYPTADGGWKTISFKAGAQHMDGKKALEYVRSRHGNNGEGSDFARSRRQQLVLEAVRDKLLSMGTLANPKKINDLINVISDHVQTDLSAWDMLSMAPKFVEVDPSNIINRVLTDAADGELSPAMISQEYMLFPRKPDWSEIRAIAANPFLSKEEEVKSLQPKAAVYIEIKNGTTYEGYASKVYQRLKALGYKVNEVSNAQHKGYDKTVIYDLTSGKMTDDLVKLKKMLNAEVSSTPPQAVSKSTLRTILTDYMVQETINASSTQFLIILGDSSLGLIQPSYESQNTP